MAIGAYFANESFDKKKYEEALKRLEAAGQGAPKGRKYHSCFGEGDHLMVFDVWESQEDLDKFGETLMPILADLKVNARPPDIMPMVNEIFGQ
jgi:hypothetical protein